MLKIRFLKTITYKTSSLLLTSSIAYILTGRINIACYIGIIDFIVTSSWYFVHEYLWEKILKRFNGRKNEITLLV